MTEEYVYHVDEDDNVIGKVTRKEVDYNKLRTRGSRVIISNNKNEILIQKRASTKRKYPNHWDFGTAETLMYGESYESGAIRGLLEELNIYGISNFDIKFLFKLKYEDEEVKRWYKVYSLIYDGKITIDKNEVSVVKFVSIDVLDQMIETDKFAPQGLEVYKEFKRLRK